jgi:hypothetical protein
MHGKVRSNQGELLRDAAILWCAQPSRQRDLSERVAHSSFRAFMRASSSDFQSMHDDDFRIGTNLLEHDELFAARSHV